MKLKPIIYKTFILLTITIVSCSKDENFTINNLNGNKIDAYGHAGMGNRSTYPLNCYESLLKCLNFGADGTELDVQLTKDNILVAFHDIDLSENTTINGLIHSLTWAEIQKAVYKNPIYTNYNIITLDHFFANVENLNTYIYTFDIKLNSSSSNMNKYLNSFVNELSKIITKYNLLNNSYIESQDEDFLKLLQLKNSNYKLFIYPSSFDNGLETAIRLNLFGITISTENITKEQIRIAHDNNLFVTIWGIHSTSANKDGIRKNPDFIQSDKIKNLIHLVD